MQISEIEQLKEFNSQKQLNKIDQNLQVIKSVRNNITKFGDIIDKI